MNLRITKIELFKKGFYSPTHALDITTCYSAQLSNLKILRELNAPSLLDVGLFNPPVAIGPDDYLLVHHNQGDILFGGFVSETPSYQFLGSDGTVGGKWGYLVKATSDEYLFNSRAIPIGCPPYINQYHKDILIDLANRIMSPGTFIIDNDPSGSKGNKEAFYTVDPTKKFSEIAAEFAETDNHRYWFNGLGRFNYTHLISDDGLLTDAEGNKIREDGSNRNQHDSVNYLYLTDYKTDGPYNPNLFTHANLNLNQLDNEYKNDVIIVGDICPSYSVNEEHIADGVTSSFRLKDIPYGIEGAILIEDTWAGSEIDTTKWTIKEPSVHAGEVFKLFDGYLNVEGSSGDSLSENYIRSNSGVEMAGEVLVRAGELIFEELLGGTGVIGGLYPSDPPTSCSYGFYVQSDNKLRPIIDGVAVGDTHSITTGKSYIPRIHISVDEPHRILNTPYQEYETISATVPSNGRIRFELEVYDIADPENVEYVVLHTAEIKNVPTALLFYPVIQSNLHMLICNTEVSKPVQIEAIRTSSVEKNSDGSYKQWAIKIGSSLNGADAALQVSGNVCDLTFYDVKSDGKTINIPSLGEKVSLRYWAVGKAQYHIRDIWAVRDKKATYLEALPPSDPANLVLDAVTSSGSTANTIVIESTNASFMRTRDYYANYLVTWSITGTTIDATIINSSSNVLTVVTGESGGLIPNALIPPAGTIVTIFRSRNKLFDDGVRSAIVTDLTPLPRNDREAEIAAKAYLWDHTKPKWEGSYSGILGDIIKDIPMPGARVLLEVRHFDTLLNKGEDGNRTYVIARLQEVNLEEFGSVQNPETGKLEAAVKYNLTFKTSDKLKRFLNTLLLNRRGVLTGVLSSTKEYNQYTEPYNTIADVASVKVTSISPTTISFKIDNTSSESRYVEVRSGSDTSWGQPTDNLVGLVGVTGNLALSSSTSVYATVNRLDLGRRTALYFRLTDGAFPSITNTYSRHASLLYVDYPGTPPAPESVATTLNERITFNVSLPGTNVTVAGSHFNDSETRKYYAGDFAGIEIRDKFRNLLYKGDGYDVYQSPAFNTVPETVYKKDFLYKNTLAEGDTLASHTGYQTITFATAPVDMNGRVWHVDQYAGYLLHIGFSSGGTQHTILGGTATTLDIDTTNGSTLASLETGANFYITVSTEYTAQILSNNNIEISWPRNVNDRLYNDYYVNTYNVLGEVNYHNKITAVDNTGAGGRVVLTFEDPFCTEATAADFKSTYTTEEGTVVQNQYFAVGDHIALVSSTATGNSAVVYDEIYAVAAKKITITSTVLASGFTDLVGGFVHKLLEVKNDVPTATTVTPTYAKGSETPKKLESLSWEGTDATHYELYLSTPPSNHRTIHIIHPGTEASTQTIKFTEFTEEERTGDLRYILTPHDDFGAATSIVVNTESGDTAVPDAPLVTASAKNLEIQFVVTAPALVPPATSINWKGVFSITLEISYTGHETGDFDADTAKAIYTVNNTKQFTQIHKVTKDGTYYYRAKATNTFGTSAYSEISSVSASYGDISGNDYEKDWFGVFLHEKGIVGRKNVAGSDTRNPAVFLLAANDFDGKTALGADDPVLPPWSSGDIVFSDDVEKALVTPSTASYYLKFTGGALNIKGATVSEGTIGASAFLTAGYYTDPQTAHVVINNSGIAGWSGPETNVDNLMFAVATTLTQVQVGNLNFNINPGDLWAKAGYLGRWRIADYIIDSGWDNTNTYVALNSNPSGTYAMWAGNSVDSAAPFRVKRDGSFYLGNLTNYLSWDSGTGTLTVSGSVSITNSLTLGNVLAGHIILNSDGIAGYQGAESTDNLSFLAATTGGSYTLSGYTYVIGAGDVWMRRGYIGGTGTSSIIEVEPTGLTGYDTSGSIAFALACGNRTYTLGTKSYSIAAGDLWIRRGYIGGGDTSGDSSIMEVSSSGIKGYNSSGTLTFIITTKPITFNGTTLGAGYIGALAGTIGGWNLGATRLDSGITSSYVALDSDPTGTYALWAGNASASSASFYVTRGGAIKATSGTIGGWQLDNETLKNLNTTPKIILNSSDTAPYISIGSTAPTVNSSGSGVFIDQTGLYALYSNTQNFKFETSTGNITLQGKMYLPNLTNAGVIVGPTSGAHITINPTGIALWSASSEVAANLSACISNTWTGSIVVNGETISIDAGDFFAKNGHFTGTLQATGGFIGLGSGSTGAVVIDANGLYLKDSITGARFSSGQSVTYTAITGFWLGNDSGTYKFRVGDPVANKLTWDGSELYIKGRLSIEGTSGTPSQINGVLSIINGGLVAGATNAGHVVINTSGIVGYNGSESADNISFLASTTGGTYAVTGHTYTIAAGDVWMRRGYIGGDGSGDTIEVTPSYIQSNGYAAGTAGFKIQCDGKAFFNELTISVPADIISGTVGGMHITPTNIHSASYPTSGFIINSSGSATFTDVTATGTVNATGGFIGAANINPIESWGMKLGTYGLVATDNTIAFHNSGGYNVPVSTSKGILLGWRSDDTSAYKFFAGDATLASPKYIAWNGAEAIIYGTIYASNGTVGGWSIGATTLNSSTVGFDSTDAISIWAGAPWANRDSAEFQVRSDGSVYIGYISSTTFTKALSITLGGIYSATGLLLYANSSTNATIELAATKSLSDSTAGGSLTLRGINSDGATLNSTALVSNTSISLVTSNLTKFFVNSAGDITYIKGLQYSFPTVQVNGGFLKYSTTGNQLTWETVAGTMASHDLSTTVGSYHTATCVVNQVLRATGTNAASFGYLQTADIAFCFLNGSNISSGLVPVSCGGTGANLSGSAITGIVYKNTASTLGVTTAPTNNTYLKYTPSGFVWDSPSATITWPSKQTGSILYYTSATTVSGCEYFKLYNADTSSIDIQTGASGANNIFRLGSLNSSANTALIEFYSNGGSVRTAWISHNTGDTTNFLIKKQGNTGYIILGTGNDLTTGTMYVNSTVVSIGGAPSTGYATLEVKGALNTAGNIDCSLRLWSNTIVSGSYVSIGSLEASTTPSFNLMDNTGATRAYFSRVKATGMTYLACTNTDTLNFMTNGVVRMSILSSGEVVATSFYPTNLYLPLSSAVTSPVEGCIAWNRGTGRLNIYNGTIWKEFVPV